MKELRSAYEARVARGLRRDPLQEEVIARLDTLREELQPARPRFRRFLLRTPPPPRGLYVWGDVGRGKSMLVDMLMADLGAARGRRTHFHAFMRDIHRALHLAREEGRDDPVAAAADGITNGLDLLALDEVEITDITDAMIVGRVFERLLGRGVVLVATSNSPPGDLYRDGLKRELFLPFVRLIEAGCDIVHLAGDKDYRAGGDIDGDLYLSPADGDAARRIDALWRELCGPAETSVTLAGRAALRRKGEAVRGAFDELCRGPLASSDYLSLTRLAQVVFLEDVPLLRERDRDAARRFILLIDTLYDTRRGIVISAAAGPDELHAGGEFEREFRRTASRLREMTRPDWPGRPRLR